MLRNLTQKQLSRISGVSQQFISDLEISNRKKSPTLKTLRDLARALNVCVYALFEPISCSRDYEKCDRTNKFLIGEEYLEFTEVLNSISKEKNVPVKELLKKSIELIKKEYS